MRRDRRASATENLPDIRIRANDSNRLDLLEWEQTFFIFQQDNRFLRRRTHDLAMLRLILPSFFLQFRPIEETCLIEHAQQPANLVIEHLFGQWTFIKRAFDHLFRHPAGFPGHFKIEPTAGNIAVIGTKPVGHNDALVSPFAFENFHQGVIVLAGIGPIDAVVR